nr:threonine/serine exporter family protein [Lysinibacter cavernae]
MLGAIGALLLTAGTNAVNEIDSTLRSLAYVYGRPQLKVVALPTMVLIEDPTTVPARMAVFPVKDLALLRLDQTGQLESLIKRISVEPVTPSEVLAETERIMATPPRFRFIATLAGHVLLTVGFGLVLNPTPEALPVYFITGLAVGLIVLLGARIRTLSLVLPVVAAFVSVAIVGLGPSTLTQDDTLRLVAPSLVSLLPGLTLTVAAVELTHGQIIAGSSRLVYGFARLALLAFGVYLGLATFGVETHTASAADRLGPWAPWLGVVLVAFGYSLFSIAPKRSLPWITVALVIAHAGQVLGSLLVGSELSGMVGAIVAVLAVTLLSRVASSPPSSVMLTCSYWVLVPGSMGFIGLSEAASGMAGAGSMIINTLGAILAIAIGMVLGAGISHDTGSLARTLRATVRARANERRHG